MATLEKSKSHQAGYVLAGLGSFEQCDFKVLSIKSLETFFYHCYFLLSSNDLHYL